MRKVRMLALGASLLVLFGACTTGGGSKPTIKVGSDGFDEARVMAEVYAQVLEHAGYTVDRAGIGLGTRDATNAALFSGQIDMKPEYIGSGAAKLGGQKTSDSATNAANLQTALNAKNVTVFGYTPGQDTNALVVRKETADQFHLTKWSDLTAVADQLKWGLATDCPTNTVCGGALKDSYGIDISKLQTTLLDACSADMDAALTNKTVDVAELCSTGPEILVNGWVLLQDDKNTQPADNIAPIIRNDWLAKTDKAAVQKLLDAVSAKVDTATLASLYKQVSVDKTDIKVVASTWLKANGFI
ncbi:MAG TPA: glycine betaine ABC transporter substrate-binding protein [Candidatus Limnocylindrales bacterium]